MVLTNTNKQKQKTIDLKAQALVTRKVLEWLNDYADKPCKLELEFLPESGGAALAITQVPYVTKKYIVGGYAGSFEADIVYRTIPLNDEDRLTADELLNSWILWATEGDLPEDVENLKFKKVSATTLSTLQARYQDGVEDRAAHLVITYENI